MESRKTLLSKAADVCGSRYALAKRLDVAESTLSFMASGKRPIGPRIAARLAEIVGDDPRDQALAALVEQETNPTVRQELSRLFKLAPAAAAFAMTVLLGATSPTAEAASIDAHASDTGGRLYIM